jgi:hypothetical protein
MRLFSIKVLLGVAALAMTVGVLPVSAQITTGTLAGTVQDIQGGVIPGATVTLISESRGTRGVPGVTNATGDFVFPNTTPDTYIVEVTMSGFRTLRRSGVAVSGGDRVVVGVLRIEPGGATETVTVTAEAPLIQAQSGERSFAVSTDQIASLPLGGGRNFTAMLQLVPGVTLGGASAGGTRLGGVGQNNIMMDGISAMDTGNNGQMLSMNVESIAEVKVLTQGYQAEYGRASGLQVTAVTKSGTNRFHGSLYDIEDNSDWNTNSWQNQKNGIAKTVSKQRTWGYSLGGPVGKPGGDNKLFFFYSHEYRPSTNNAGQINRFRVPTALERAGNFSQSLDNNGVLIGQLLDPVTRQPYAGNIIPASSIYAPGLAVLNQYPMPNLTQAPSTSYNLELVRLADKNLLQQPAIRLDYQFSPALRVTGKFSGERQRERIIPGTMESFNDVKVPYPYISNLGVTVNYTFNPTTFIEATYGSIKNELAGGNNGGIVTSDYANRQFVLGALPLIYPDAGRVDPRYYQVEALQRTGAIYFDGTSVNLPPVFQWGGLIGSQPPNLQYPGWLNVNKTQDFAISVTKVSGRHTIKGGFYNNHSFKAQNVAVGGAPATFQGTLNFGNSTNNPLDTGFGFANALTGVFTSYAQASKLIEGSMLYNNTEAYIQDNWKVSSRFTLDYGMRFTRQQPQYDQFLQMTNFFPTEWSAASAPVLYVAGCRSGAAVCSGNDRNAADPRTGAILSAPGANNTAAAIGTLIPGTGSPTNGIKVAGQGISKYSYNWPTIAYGPRVGGAFDLRGDQTIVLRGSAGVFYDRPDGNTVFAIPGNPPIAESISLSNSQLQTLGLGLSTVGASSMVVFQHDAKIPSSAQWSAGVQMTLPWASVVDVAYVGNHGYNRLSGLQGGNQINLNSIDLGSAYLARNQDATRGTSTTPGAVAVDTNLMRAFRGFGSIGQHTTDFYDTYHSIQTSFNRRFRGGMSFGLNHTLSLAFYGNTGLTKRFDHAADGTPVLRADQAKYEELFRDLDLRRHIVRGNMVWDMPDLSTQNGGVRRVLALLVNDWQLSGILTAGSGSHYDLGYTYQNNGANINLTGSPDFGARIVYTGDPGTGCTGLDNQYAQFNAAAVTGPGYFSDGLESGRNILQNCADKFVDLSLSRTIRFGAGRTVNLRVDAFNAFNTVVINGRNTTIQYDNPVAKTILNPQFNADGSVVSTRVTPQTAGFGGATSAAPLRTIRLAVRFGF